MDKEPDEVRYVASDNLLREVHHRFTYRTPTADEIYRLGILRTEAQKLALLILEFTPYSREQSAALTRLGECVRHADAAIARGEAGDPFCIPAAPIEEYF